jgi:hypothetical protein
MENTCPRIKNYFKKLVNPTKMEKIISKEDMHRYFLSSYIEEPRPEFFRMEKSPILITQINPKFTKTKLRIRIVFYGNSDDEIYESSRDVIDRYVDDKTNTMYDMFSIYYPIFYKDFINKLKNNSIHTPLDDYINDTKIMPMPICDFIKLIISKSDEEDDDWGNERERLIHEELERHRMIDEGVGYIPNNPPIPPKRADTSILNISCNFEFYDSDLSISFNINGYSIRQTYKIRTDENNSIITDEYGAKLKTKKIMPEFKEIMGLLPADDPKSIIGKKYRKTKTQFTKKSRANRGGKTKKRKV